MSNQSYILVRKPIGKKTWNQRVLCKKDKVIKHLESHILKMENMYASTRDKYFLKAIECSNAQLELVRLGNEEVINRFNFGK